MKICFGCFEQYDDAFDMCPHCGYVEGTEPELAMYMRPGTVLQERYVIGVALFCAVAKASVATGITACVLPFIPTAIIKAILASVIGFAIRERVPALKK